MRLRTSRFPDDGKQEFGIDVAFEHDDISKVAEHINKVLGYDCVKIKHPDGHVQQVVLLDKESGHAVRIIL